MLTEANQQMTQLQVAAGTRFQVVIRAGVVSHAVAKAVKDFEADLLVIGRRSDPASEGLGLNTYGLIRESACPVVSV